MKKKHKKLKKFKNLSILIILIKNNNKNRKLKIQFLMNIINLDYNNSRIIIKIPQTNNYKIINKYNNIIINIKIKMIFKMD